MRSPSGLARDMDRTAPRRWPPGPAASAEQEVAWSESRVAAAGRQAYVEAHLDVTHSGCEIRNRVDEVVGPRGRLMILQPLLAFG